MKRILSLLLCLITCISFFSSSVIPVSAIDEQKNYFTVKESVIKDGKITFTVSIIGGVSSFGGATILVKYDSTVLKPVKVTPAYSGSGFQIFSGIYEHGISKEYEDRYAVGYMNTIPESVNTNTKFFDITFEAINDARPSTDVTFYCKEFLCIDDPEQSISQEDGLQLIQKISDIKTLEAPELVGATLTTNAVVFEWKAAVGAKKYKIRRMTKGGTWNTDVATVSSSTLKYKDTGLKSGKTYIYSVVAVNADGETSLFDSNGVSCKYISKPTNIKAVSSVGGVSITWDEAAGADKYRIVRRESGEDAWTMLCTRSASLDTSYKDTTVKSGKTYEYDVNSCLGSFSTKTTDEWQTVTYLTAPLIATAENVSNGIEIKWDAVKNIAYYKVYRKEVGKDKTLKVYADNVVSNKYVDKNVESKKAYTYSVQAVSKYGDESSYSKSGYTITRVPSTKITTISPQSSYIKVYWKSVDGVDGYNIYRKTKDSSWKKAGSVSAEERSFKDTGAVSGKTYYYCAVPFIGNSESEKVCSSSSAYYLKAPQNVQAANKKTSIRVSWTASAGASEYRVYRKYDAKGDGKLIATLSADNTSFVDKNTKNGKVYSYYVQAVSSKGISKPSKTTPAIMRMKFVENIKAKIVSEGITISWSEHSAADYYIVCRKSGDSWENLDKTKKLKYTDKTVASGKVYAYTVIPVVDGYKGGFDEGAVKEYKYLAPPQIKKTTISSSSITVTWSKVSGAKKYKLQRALTDSSGKIKSSYKTIATVNADKTSFKDINVTAGQGYAYRVYTVNGTDGSVASQVHKCVFLATQKIKKLSNGYGGTKIIWYASKGAEKYRIYRKEDGKDWVLITKVSKNHTSYVDKGAKNGVKTYYAVRSENGSSISTYKTKSHTYFASPEVKLANRTAAINVSWDKITGATSYYVYRKAPGEKSWKKIATVTKNIYSDKNVTAGKKYTYTVRAYNGKILSGYNPNGWTIKRLTAPKLKSAANFTSGITVTWEKVTGASKYLVYRKSSLTSGWELIGTTKSLSYVDKGAKSSKTYIYTVVAVDGGSRSIYDSEGLEIKRLTTPVLKSVKSGKSGVTFKWSEVAGASGYYVYRKTGASSWTRVAQIKGKGNVSYLDETAVKGTTYTYTVRAYSGSDKSHFNTTGLKVKDLY